jgi:hypothetical protein
LKTVIVAGDGNLSIAENLTEMQAWLAERNIAARELTMLHILNFQVVFRATFEDEHKADQFAVQFS